MVDSMPVCGKKAFGRPKEPDGKTVARQNFYVEAESREDKMAGRQG